MSATASVEVPAEEQHAPAWPPGRYGYSDDPGPPEGWMPPPLAENPLGDLYDHVGGWESDGGPVTLEGVPLEEMPWYRRSRARRHATRRYAWAVPSEGALARIAERGPIVEVGAGRGYWAALLRLRGVDVVATDAHWYPPTWTDVAIMDAAEAAAAHPDRALLLIWPPYNQDTAHRALCAYRGSTVIYIGEGYGGCTGDDAFHEALEREWRAVDGCSVPQWSGLHDHLTVYARSTPPSADDGEVQS